MLLLLQAGSWALAAPPAGAYAGAGAGAGAGPAERGRLIYETGHRADGSPVHAERLGLGTVPAHAAACAHCHRRSGMGQREGKLLVPAVQAQILFAPLHKPTLLRAHPALQRQPLRANDRAAYTPAAFATAVRTGVDVNQRPLDTTMPRYTLSNRDVADLEAHLRALSNRAPPGAQGGVMHLATVLTPQAAARTRHTVRTTISAWAQQLKLGGWRVQWKLWELQGPPGAWRSQLEALWRAQPVFAMVSGASGLNWQPVAAFCEQHTVPCIFPTLERLPEGAANSHFNFYLSAGIEAETALFAQWAAQTAPAPRRLVQFVQAGDPAGLWASRLMPAALQAAAVKLPLQSVPVQARPGPAGAGAAPHPTAGLAQLQAGDVALLWLRPDAVSALLQAAPPAPGVRVWLSATLAPPHQTLVPRAWLPHVSWASTYSNEIRRHAGGALSAQPWSNALGLPPDLDPIVLGDVHAATYFFTDALARMRDGFSAEYLTERLEAAVDLGPASANYFRLSLGPNQRVAAQGGHMLGFEMPLGEHLKPVSPYLLAPAGESPQQEAARRP